MKAIDGYLRIGGKRLSLNPLTGDPLTDPSLANKVATEILREFAYVELYTNGILLQKNQNIRTILDSGITTLFISIAAFDCDKYRIIMGVDRYDEVLSGIIELLRENTKLEKPKDIHFSIKGGLENLATDDFLDKILPLIDERFVKYNIQFLRMYDGWGGAISRKDIPDSCGFQSRGALRLRPCCWTFGITIMADGCVRACGCRYGKKGSHDDLIIGDLHINSLEEIWRSQRLKDIHRAFRDLKQPEICQKCNNYSPV